MSEYNEDSTCEHGNDALSLVCGLCIEEHEQVVAKEVAELRAYKERTEAALRAWCDDLTQFLADAESGGDERMVLFTRSEIEDWKEAGLWRDREPQP